MKSKSYLRLNDAKKYAQKLKQNGQSDVQIWELPVRKSQSTYVVLWPENKSK